MSDLIEGLVAPLRATIAALLGLWLAWQWTSGVVIIPLFFAAGGIVIGYLFERIGLLLLTKKPVAAVRSLELWIFSPLTVSAVASATIVLSAIWLGVPATASATTKELAKGLTATLSAFLTTGFVSWAGDQEDSFLSRRIARRVREKFKRPEPNQPRQENVKYFRAGSAGERWVYSTAVGGVEGWGHAARFARARGIAVELKSGASNAPP